MIKTIDIIVSFLAVLSVVNFYKNDLHLTLILIILSAYYLKTSTKHERKLYVIAAVGGPVGEMIAINSGAWKYAFPSVLGVPYWLPFGWGLVSVIFSRLSESL